MMRLSLLTLFLFLLASCTTAPEKERLNLTPASFDDLKGWEQDMPASALSAFKRSCKVLVKKPPQENLDVAGKASAWHQACAAAQKTLETDASARAYFESWFQPYSVSGNEGSEGLFTGYYLPELQGSLQREGIFQTPLYARPSDRIEVDLGLFKSSFKGQHIIGKVDGTQLVPYDAREAIAKGSLAARAKPLVWLNDPIGAFFLEIQGSGRIRLTNGQLMPIGYDGTNGLSYLAIGRFLADRGDLPRPVSMSSIRQWLVSHPQDAQEVMNKNPSYVFFRILPNEDAIGAEGIPLTAGRSLAVDPDFVPLGVPLWLDTTDAQGASLQRLMIAQDTGGAIKGVVRADVFWGEGENAAQQAGAMQSQGRYYLLLPKTVASHDN